MQAQEGAASLAEHAYERLRASILHGDLAPGERLRPAELRDRFDLGLTPIREALGRLAAEGLVVVETNRATRVRAASGAEFADLMATRRTVERWCLAAAIAAGDGTWEAEISASLDALLATKLPASARDRAAATLWEVAHRRFHCALVEACGSPWMLRFWGLLADHSERYRKIRLLRHAEAAAEVRDLAGEHTALARAVLARDAALAMNLMDAHLLATERSVARLLQPKVD